MRSNTPRIGLLFLFVLLASLAVASRLWNLGGTRPGGALWIKVSAEEYGPRWPFTFHTGLLTCPSRGKVLIADAKTLRNYAMTPAALNSPSNWPAYQTVLRPGAGESLIPELTGRAQKLCALNPD